MRLDRSQQGVAPRSCLSSRPVKPRARPPPGGGPGPRGSPMMGPHGRPMSPTGRVPSGPPLSSGRFYPQDTRPRSPIGPGYAGPPAPRPYPGHTMSPGPRSMSPGPAGQPVPRSMSPGPSARPVPRSMSPGPYGPPGMQRPMIPVNQRQRSNSAGNISPPRFNAPAPPRPSPLAANKPPTPAPKGGLPALPSSASSSPLSQISRKPAPTQDV